MRYQNHARMLVLMKCDDPPEWFLRAYSESLSDPRPTDQKAATLWRELREGSDPGDLDLAAQQD